jgi:hypothetical protein
VTKSKAVLLVAAVAMCLAASQAAQATTTIFTSRSTWETAVGAYEEEAFSDTTLNAGLSVVTTAGSISGGVWNDRVVNGGDKTTWTFADLKTAFGGNWDLSPGGAGQGIQLYIDATPVSSIIDHNYVGEFFGFTSTVAFNKVVVTGDSQAGVAETYTMDNMVYDSPASAIPEPITMLGLAWGGLALAGYVRKRK